MADEIHIADEFLYETLGGDGDLTALLAVPPAEIGEVSIYFDSVPQEVEASADPVIIIRHLPPRDDDDFITFNGLRIWTTMRARIVANAATRQYDSLSAVADRIDELLHLTKDHVTSGWVHKAQRLAPYTRAYVDVVEYRERGADWLFQASKTVGF